MYEKVYFIIGLISKERQACATMTFTCPYTGLGRKWRIFMKLGSNVMSLVVITPSYCLMPCQSVIPSCWSYEFLRWRLQCSREHFSSWWISCHHILLLIWRGSSLQIGASESSKKLRGGCRGGDPDQYKKSPTVTPSLRRYVVSILTVSLINKLVAPIGIDSHNFAYICNSIVGMATGYGLNDRWVGVRVLVWSRIFLFSTSSKPALVSTQPFIQCVPGALSPRVKRQVREADHSPPASAEVKKMWIYISTPPYAFMA
jgi:hypothetical protein